MGTLAAGVGLIGLIVGIITIVVGAVHLLIAYCYSHILDEAEYEVATASSDFKPYTPPPVYDDHTSTAASYNQFSAPAGDTNYDPYSAPIIYADPQDNSFTQANYSQPPTTRGNDQQPPDFTSEAVDFGP